MKEYEGDNNQDHFQRDEKFAQEVQDLLPKLTPELRKEFLDFLVTSLTSEFSGCIIYNEIRNKITNPDIKQLMTFMTWDEASHAGFIKWLSCTTKRKSGVVLLEALRKPCTQL